MRRRDVRVMSLAVAAAAAVASTQCTLLVDTDGLAGGAGAADGAVQSADAVAPRMDAANGTDTSADVRVQDAKPFPIGAVVWPNNGHAYVVVVQPLTWDQARDASTKAGGHLVTIGSSAENDFVYSLVATNDAVWQLSQGKHLGPWLGGYQRLDATGPADGWEWVTGEPFSYTSWEPGQPNDANGNETKLRYYGETARTKNWADASTETDGYIIEFE